MHRLCGHILPAALRDAGSRLYSPGGVRISKPLPGQDAGCVLAGDHGRQAYDPDRQVPRQAGADG